MPTGGGGTATSRNKTTTSSNKHNLTPIQTDFLAPPHGRRPPASPGKHSNVSGSTSGALSTGQPTKSRSSFFNIFSSKPKAERAYASNEVLPPAPKYAASVDRLSRPGSSYSRFTSPSYVDVSSIHSRQTDPAGPRRLQSRRSTNKLRSNRMPPPNHALAVLFTPPPLFQAYPQSTKNIQLEAPEKVRNTEQTLSGNQERPKEGIGAKLFALARHKKKPQQLQTSYGGKQNIHGYVWMPKIYILVTSGHLLQYSADGPSDRLPEKILKLERDSSAFASDVLPGSTLVLQILRTAKDYEVPSLEEQKPLRSKLGLEGKTSRKMTTNLLMVFDDPCDMEDWTIAIREEIERMGGKKSRPSISGDQIDDTESISPSHRFMLVDSQSNLALPLSSPIKSSPNSPTMVPPEYESGVTPLGSSPEWAGSAHADGEGNPASCDLTKRASIIASRSHPSYAELTRPTSGVQSHYLENDKAYAEPMRKSSPRLTDGFSEQYDLRRSYGTANTVGRRKTLQTPSQIQNYDNEHNQASNAKLKRHSTYNDRMNGYRPSADAIRRRNSGATTNDLLRTTQYRSDPALNTMTTPNSYVPPSRRRSATLNDPETLYEDQVTLPPMPRIPTQWDRTSYQATKRLSMPAIVDKPRPRTGSGHDKVTRPFSVNVESAQSPPIQYPKRTSSLQPLQPVETKSNARGRPASAQARSAPVDFLPTMQVAREAANSVWKRPVSTIEPLPRPNSGYLRRPGMKTRGYMPYTGFSPGPPPNTPLPILPASGLIVG